MLPFHLLRSLRSASLQGVRLTHLSHLYAAILVVKKHALPHALGSARILGSARMVEMEMAAEVHVIVLLLMPSRIAMAVEEELNANGAETLVHATRSECIVGMSRYIRLLSAFC